ncbi:DUF4386 domain-containing protein [Pontimicrobium aquaticum]|uniref:DUF4386 domain-containing protein n=1 Tax=Pontimicrobium aquaticum TaxID=2565367 RepID=A0A4U0EW94_9FLAO|nr:DUF4386 domain-containing protein [Pontimicrobium aquaticum]TJY36175.1 DUF4386 domain-containing protein [Pontimicrobium aquaticum]
MEATKNKAKIAGLLYLLMAISGGIGIMYIPSNFIVEGDAVATAMKVNESDFLFRLVIVSNLICQTSFVFLVLALSQLFKEVDPKKVKLMLILVSVAVPIAFLNTLNLIAAQLVLSDVDYLSTFKINQLHALMMLFLKLFQQGNVIVQVFWGLWLYPLGMLIIKSKFIPKIIGVFLIIGCFSYLIITLTSLLLPNHSEMITSILMLPLVIGEFSIIFWLLIKGVKTK